MAENQEAMICPDSGACHHDCTDACFRVQTCGPLSGVFPGNVWPEHVVAAHAASPTPVTDPYAVSDEALDAMERNSVNPDLRMLIAEVRALRQGLAWPPPEPKWAVRCKNTLGAYPVASLGAARLAAADRTLWAYQDRPRVILTRNHEHEEWVEFGEEYL